MNCAPTSRLRIESRPTNVLQSQEQTAETGGESHEMEQARWELGQLKPSRDTVLTIGVFDGVHRGHQYLLRQVVEKARETNRLSGVVTFHPHPRSVLHPELPLYYVSSIQERMELLSDTGIDVIAKLTFSRQLASVSAAEFVEMLQQYLRMQELIVGPDFALGRGREGNVDTLRELSRQRGFELRIIGPITWDTLTVSSTGVRRAIAEGNVVEAEVLLGRRLSLTGKVIVGDQRGRTLGFPTANLEVAPELALPRDGIYVTVSRLGEAAYPSVTSIGIRPTFSAGGRTVETYILDFTGDIYGQTMRLEFVERLRDELKFSSIDALVAQIRQDVESARAVLCR